jgi:hypothetical protein
MNSREDLEKRYATLSNDQLMDIIEKKFDYTELAVTIAFEELSRRKISEDDVKKYKDSKIEQVETFIVRNIVDDLTLIQKNLFFFIWIPLLNFPFKRNFSDDGFVLKLKQANYYSWLGFGFFMLDGIISAYFDFSNWTSLIIWILTFLLAYTYDENFNRQSQIRKLQRMFGEQNDETKQENK